MRQNVQNVEVNTIKNKKINRIISIAIIAILLASVVFGFTTTTHKENNADEEKEELVISIKNDNDLRSARFGRDNEITNKSEDSIKNEIIASDDIGDRVQNEQEASPDISTAVAQARVIEEDSSNIWWLACAIYHEGRGMSDEAQIAIASVVLNRVNSPEFPNTIFEVLVQKGQYSFVRGEIIDGNPDDRALANAVYVYQNGSQIPDNVVYQSMFKQGGGIWKVIEGEYFCYG